MFIYFTTPEADLALAIKSGIAPNWLRFPVGGLDEDEARALANHLASRLGWSHWHVMEN